MEWGGGGGLHERLVLTEWGWGGGGVAEREDGEQLAPEAAAARGVAAPARLAVPGAPHREKRERETDADEDGGT